MACTTALVSLYCNDPFPNDHGPRWVINACDSITSNSPRSGSFIQVHSARYYDWLRAVTVFSLGENRPDRTQCVDSFVDFTEALVESRWDIFMPTDNDIAIQIQRILASRLFSRSERLCR